MLFRGVRYIKEFQDGYAFGYPHEDAWISRIEEFTRLEKLAWADEFQFQVRPEPDKNMVWLDWRGDPKSIQVEFERLSPRYNPVGRVTLIKEEPLVSIVVAITSGDVISTVKQLFKQVRPPIEIVVLADQLPAELNEYERVVATQDWQGHAHGGLVVFMDTTMPVESIPDMLVQLHVADIVLGVPAEASLTGRLLEQAARTLLDDKTAYNSLFWALKGSIFRVLPLGDNPVAFLHEARQRGLKIVDMPVHYKTDTSLVTGLRQIFQARRK